ncbi:histidine phosphatase family protein [Clostridium saccharobutylicum]|uniref:histidine phosphatase family protein n=1 Tax=Clostridium saccharobutylicum TaxID=169679 RepID=UPI00241C775C|nr:histidine phosphatase family protein [Clostridium saccharobutylicum]
MNENCDNVVIVTHSAVIMFIQCYLTNTPFNEMTKFKTDNTSITEIFDGVEHVLNTGDELLVRNRTLHQGKCIGDTRTIHKINFEFLD